MALSPFQTSTCLMVPLIDRKEKADLQLTNLGVNCLCSRFRVVEGLKGQRSQIFFGEKAEINPSFEGKRVDG